MTASGTETLWSDLHLLGPGAGDGGAGPMPRLVDWPNLGHRAPAVCMCPVCGHHVTIFVDTFAGNQHYVEDCPLCCCAIELDISVREYKVASVTVERPF